MSGILFPYCYRGIQIFSITLFLSMASVMPCIAEDGQQKEYTHFCVFLPAGWDGEEQTGFISDNAEEYLLVLGKKDEEGDKFLAQISIYLLPNKPGASPEQAAQKLAEAQGDASVPVKEGEMWTFTGEPRTNVIKGQAKTLVNTDDNKMLIIIAQDPENMGSEAILHSLSAKSAEAKALLGK